jgi:hypothetical protein
LRSGERGLSLFARVPQPGPDEVIAAVRAAGKQGDLVAATISRRVLPELGLMIVPTPGGTPVPDVNGLHAEARLPRWRALLLRLVGRRTDEYFNDRFSERLLAAARVWGPEGDQ